MGAQSPRVAEGMPAKRPGRGARSLRAAALTLDIVAACAYVGLVLGGRRYLPSPWLQGHLVNVFAGYAWPGAMHQYLGRALERRGQPGPASQAQAILVSSALALLGLALFELGVQSDVTDFAVEAPGVLLFALVNSAGVLASRGRPEACDGG